MCIIAASAAGVRQPTVAELRRMFHNNPHGAGYMTARDGRVHISKGYMTWDEFAHAVRYEAFTAADPVVYHFRISTQAGVNPAMTHPFPLTRDIAKTKLLDCSCDVGVAHNGIIQLTTDRTDREYSDTARFIAEYMAFMVRTPEDLRDPVLQRSLERLTGSKLAIMDGTGEIVTVGHFTEDDGILYSNGTYRQTDFYNVGGRSYRRGAVHRSPEYIVDPDTGELIDPDTGELLDEWAQFHL